jgi:nicotinate phosphoribosyltransferase
MVYKLVEIETSDGAMRPVEKRSVNKISHGGHKHAARRSTDTGLVEVIRRDATVPEGRPLQVPVFRHGEPAAPIELRDARAHHLFARNELPVDGLDLSPGDPVTTAHLEEPA